MLSMDVGIIHASPQRWYPSNVSLMMSPGEGLIHAAEAPTFHLTHHITTGDPQDQGEG